MMKLIDENSPLWNYLSEDVRGLLVDGEVLVNDVADKPEKISDYSYLVFPFSKAYEGFLKKLFLDLGLIKEDEYYGDRIRIGRILNPHYLHDHGNIFKKLCRSSKKGEEFATRLWKLWKNGRNMVFHYFPHNFRKLSYDEALEIIRGVIAAMHEAVEVCYLEGHVKNSQ
jgi:hypothetical protein